MTEWTSKKYNEYYNSYVPWLEDKYLAWFGENKTSYTAKGILPPPILLPIFLPILHFFLPCIGHPANIIDAEQLDKTKLTNDSSLNSIQDGVNTGVSGQLKSDGLLGGVGDLVSKEGVNRAERGDSGLGEKEAIEKGKEGQKKGWGESIPGSSWITGGKK